MKDKKGFTLIELLVVISIIAVLMSILMPALGKVREQAKVAICKSNLRQWGVVMFSYAADNNGSFTQGDTEGGDMIDRWNNTWPVTLKSYYQDDEDFMLCASATKSEEENGQFPNMAWSVAKHGTFIPKDVKGSYGLNWWINNASPDFAGVISGVPYPKEYFWRKLSKVSNTSKVPMFLDSCFVYGRPIEASTLNDPPQTPMEVEMGIRRFCTDRHNGTTDGVFVDGHAGGIGLKELWTLPWSRGYNTKNRYTLAGGATPAIWPEWMQGLKDY
ncbi:MAG: type II secretion system protein [Sedimentisphaeraceae bacterium JB056]